MTISQNTDSALRAMPEEELYAMALDEARSETRRRGLWAKMLSEAMGDEAKAEVLYIKARVAELTRLQNDQTSLNYQCPNCKTIHSITKDQLATRTSMTPPAWTFFCPACKQYSDLRKAFLDPHQNSTSDVSPQKPSNTQSANTPIDQPHRKGGAIASLVCGIIGGWASTLSLAAVICGHIALVNIKKDPKTYGGKGLALAGLILGYLGVVLAIVLGTMKGWLNFNLIQMGY
jgi:uncharacterized protein YlaI